MSYGLPAAYRPASLRRDKSLLVVKCLILNWMLKILGSICAEDFRQNVVEQ